MTASAEEYHRQSSYNRYDLGGGALDFGDQPDVFKTYPGLPTVPLPQVMAWPEDDLSAVLRQNRRMGADSKVDMNALARLMVLAHTLTAKARYGGVEFYYRSVASAGALYPFELYVAARGVRGLDDGLYHHSVGLHALTLLRRGSIMPAAVEALGAPRTVSPVLMFFLTSIFFRSAWKYRDRGYRYNLLDTGHLTENLCLALRALKLPFELHYDFSDEKVNSLLGVDETREVCLAVVPVWGKRPREDQQTESLGEAPKSLRAASRVSARESDYQVIREIHSLTCRVIERPDNAPNMIDSLGLTTEEPKHVPKLEKWPEVMHYQDSVFKRRSNRNFVRAPLSSDAFSALLELLCAESGSFRETPSSGMEALSVGCLVGNVTGWEAGFYLLDTGKRMLRLAHKAFIMDQMAHACLDQAWLHNCCVHFLFLSNLDLLNRTWGPRGYRYAMLNAGRLGQRLYLGATAMRIGCCGIGAIYDGEAAQLLQVGPQVRLLYLVAAGTLRKWVDTSALSKR